ncbi:MAG: UDP-N-acetylmuramoyl-tripeptide--D-alanyl-D-alanine ligase [Proteobacteria bacterium]|nr:UDP-N-acetylmuramoyl-tripeptide--D-alanyl-D-alanine ligase [Pseudomonadota bacterium]
MEDSRIISHFDVGALADSLGARIRHSRDLRFDSVSTDSRQVVPGDLFFALRGERFDAHAFLGEVVARGCRGVVVEVQVDVPEDVVVFEVDSVEAAFGHLARAILEKRRAMGSFVTYALTGSNGKTTTKELLAALLVHKGHRVLKTKGNLNNAIGLPMTILQLESTHDVAVLELGANAPGEIAYLTGIAQPDYAIITGIGAAHLKGFGSIDGVARAKGEILRGERLRGVVLPESTRIYYGDEVKGIHCRWVGEGAGIHVTDVFSTMTGVDFRYVEKGKLDWQIHLPLLGGHNASNLAHAMALVVDESWDQDTVNEAVAGVVLPSGRLERWETPNHVVFLHDAYNANPSSMKEALALMAQLVVPDQRCLILGDMGELGNTSDDQHVALGKRVAFLGAKCLLCVGSSSVFIREGAVAGGMSPQSVFCVPREKLDPGLTWLSQQLTGGDVCLMKGSRSVALERVLTFFGAHRL